MKNLIKRLLSEQSEQPLTLTMVLVLGGLAMMWVALASQPDRSSFELGKHLLMFACMVGLVRVFEGRWLRLAWVTTVSLMGLVLVLDVAGRLI